jgi:hypothetical protein
MLQYRWQLPAYLCRFLQPGSAAEPVLLLLRCCCLQERNGINTSLYGQGTARTIADLFEEVILHSSCFESVKLFVCIIGTVAAAQSLTVS